LQGLQRHVARRMGRPNIECEFAVGWNKNLNLDALGGGKVHGRQQLSSETSTTRLRASTRLSSARSSAQHRELCTEESCGCAAHLYANQSQIEVGTVKGAHPIASNTTVCIYLADEVLRVAWRIHTLAPPGYTVMPINEQTRSALTSLNILVKLYWMQHEFQFQVRQCRIQVCRVILHNDETLTMWLAVK
jgi:hypothetical protein